MRSMAENTIEEIHSNVEENEDSGDRDHASDSMNHGIASATTEIDIDTSGNMNTTIHPRAVEEENKQVAMNSIDSNLSTNHSPTILSNNTSPNTPSHSNDIIDNTNTTINTYTTDYTSINTYTDDIRLTSTILSNLNTTFNNHLPNFYLSSQLYSTANNSNNHTHYYDQDSSTTSDVLMKELQHRRNWEIVSENFTLSQCNELVKGADSIYCV
jgi:hypothetical protein